MKIRQITRSFLCVCVCDKAEATVNSKILNVLNVHSILTLAEFSAKAPSDALCSSFLWLSVVHF